MSIDSKTTTQDKLTEITIHKKLSTVTKNNPKLSEDNHEITYLGPFKRMLEITNEEDFFTKYNKFFLDKWICQLAFPKGYYWNLKDYGDHKYIITNLS